VIFGALKRHTQEIPMDTAKNTLVALWHNEDGATALEYGLIAALIAVGLVGILGTVGTKLVNAFTTISGALP
jgi:pilus assembly protein Flp/PilA